MHIGIDLRCMPPAGENGAGIPHAARELVRALIGIGGREHLWTLYLPKSSLAKNEKSLYQDCHGHDCRVVKLESATGEALRRGMAQHPCQILFVPSGAVAMGLRLPCIPWVHDIAIFDHPEWFPQSLLKRTLTTNLFRKGVLKAPEVLAVSEFTKGQLVKRFGLDPHKIRVTLEGGDSILGGLDGQELAAAKRDAKKKLAERGVVKPYILCLGTLEPRKNIPVLLEAWLDARASFKHATDLVIAGRDGWKLGPIVKSLEAAKADKKGGASHLHRIETPTDDHKRDLLLGAELVALPSLYEGFGLVALESLQAGTAVMASNGGALPEVVGEAGIKLPADDVKAWQTALVDCVNDQEIRRRLAEAGKIRSREFAWGSAAQIVFEVLTKIKV